MTYQNTFILVAPDCAASEAIVPAARGEKVPIHLIQYELLIEQPYTYTHDDLIFAVHVRYKGIAEGELEERGEAIRAELFAKSHPCLRASMLPKKYGWGVHYDAEGRIALYGLGSPEYARFAEGNEAKLLYAMRNRREGRGERFRHLL